MSCCRLWTPSLRLFLIFPELFFFSPWVALSVLVTHCLELWNVYVSLEFAGRDKSGGDKAKFVCVSHRGTAALLWLTDNTWESESCGGVLLTAEEDKVVLFSLCESKTVSQVLPDQVFAPAIFLTRNWKQEMKGNAGDWKCLYSESSMFLSVCRMFIHLFFCTSKLAQRLLSLWKKINHSVNVIASKQPCFAQSYCNIRHRTLL